MRGSTFIPSPARCCRTLRAFLSSRGVQTVKNLASLALTQVGLDAAGKTTILYKLKLGEIVTTIPTIGMVCTMDILFSPLPYLARFPVC